MADIFAALYFHILRHDPKNPEWPDRDRLVLSNGHICPVRYAAMARSGYFPIEELKTLRKFDTRLQGHPHRTILPGVETTSGPLGSGLSQAVGMAIADSRTMTWSVRRRPIVSDIQPDKIRPLALPVALTGSASVAASAPSPAELANGTSWLMVICPAVVPRQYATHMK